MVRSSGVRIARHHAACRTVDTKPRRGILADDPVSDRFGRRRWLRPLRGCGKGGAVEFLGEVPFVRTERWGIGGFRYHWLCSMFRTLSQPLPVPENGTFSLSRAQSRTCSGYAGARKRRMKFNDSPLPQTVATGVRLGVASEFRRREEPSGLRICAWPGRGTKCSSTSVRRRAARFPYGSSWPSMRRRLRSRRNSTSAGPSSLRRALSDGC